jgi:hypothetical protein
LIKATPAAARFESACKAARSPAPGSFGGCAGPGEQWPICACCAARLRRQRLERLSPLPFAAAAGGPPRHDLRLLCAALVGELLHLRPQGEDLFARLEVGRAQAAELFPQPIQRSGGGERGGWRGRGRQPGTAVAPGPARAIRRSAAMGNSI